MGDLTESSEERQKRIEDCLARGDAPLKPQFLRPKPEKLTPKAPPAPTPNEETDGAKKDEVDRSKDEDAKGKGKGKKRGRDQRGQNSAKQRKINAKAAREASGSDAQLCLTFAYANKCTWESKGSGKGCSFRHDVDAFLSTKLPDISSTCIVFERDGACPAGVNCRYGSGHIVDGKNVSRDGTPLTPECSYVLNQPYMGHGGPAEKNQIDDGLKVSVRKKQYDFSRADLCVKLWNERGNEIDKVPRFGPVLEKERVVDFKGKTVLAPLTTVGNLPFRRICVNMGVDITVGEMALAQSIMEGSKTEMALLRRHESEKCFGVQIAGGYPDLMARCAQFIDENVDCDFVDINCGCPLEDVHKRGAGSRLMEGGKKLEGIVRCMAGVLRTKALTLKMRTAHWEGKASQEYHGRIAHSLIPKLEDWGVSALTIHGRTARQRYLKLADWDYINVCSSKRIHNTPLLGCGDVMSWREAEEHVKLHGVDSIMIGRGALIKPWIFTEIKERRDWDISASERFDLLRDFTNYGLLHWGSDTRGVETTRRFLLEWLSFTCRYVPLGLLEQGPQKINWRPQPYFGRSDLETKLGSPKAEDWIEISEMLLGKVPDTFSFMPKHKSASYDNKAESQPAPQPAPQPAQS